MHKHLSIITLIGLSVVLYGAIAFQPALSDDIDASHAIAAREILQRHDWITLHVNGVRYLEKAPLLYWLVAISYQIFGINEFAVRFPTVVAIALLAGTAYWFGRWAYSQKVGLYAAMILVSCVGMFLFTRLMIPETVLTLWFTLGHFCFLQAFLGSERHKNYYYGCYICMALAVLSKGLIGIVFLAGPIFLFLLFTRQLSTWKELKLVPGTALFLAIAAPWHILVGLRNENFFWFYFINEHVLRFLNVREQRDYNRLPILQYWFLHLVWLFPWSIGLPFLAKQSFSIRPTAKRSAQINFYLALWAGFILIFFGLSSNQEYYTFPAFPAIALLLGHAVASAEQNQTKALARLYGGLAAIALLIASGLGWLIWISRNLQPTGDLAAVLNMVSADSVHYTRSLARAFDLTPQAFVELRGPTIGTILALGIGFPLVFWMHRQRQHQIAMAATVLTMWLFFICAHQAQIRFEPIISSKPLADVILRRWEPGSKIVINGNHEIASSIGFYTNQPLLMLNGRKFNLEFGSRYPDAPHVFLDLNNVRQLWRGSDQVFLFTEDVKKEALLHDLNLPVSLVADIGGKSLFTNR
ncbi:MAG TPA: glycosyltransferase family 39 protein [Crinalium sp.]|jgi:4-amino-4-deoxy-L-arabinose transferase-like glycosyltransferase